MFAINTHPQDIEITYDNAGNRTARRVIVIHNDNEIELAKSGDSIAQYTKKISSCWHQL